MMTVSILTFIWISSFCFPEILLCIVKNKRHQPSIAALIVSWAINNLLLWESNILACLDCKHSFSSLSSRESITRSTSQLIFDVRDVRLDSPVNRSDFFRKFNLQITFIFFSSVVKSSLWKFLFWKISKFIHFKNRRTYWFSVEIRNYLQVSWENLFSFQKLFFWEVALSVFRNKQLKLFIKILIRWRLWKVNWYKPNTNS